MDNKILVVTVDAILTSHAVRKSTQSWCVRVGEVLNWESELLRKFSAALTPPVRPFWGSTFGPLSPSSPFVSFNSQC